MSLSNSNSLPVEVEKYGAVYTPKELADFTAHLCLRALNVNSRPPLSVLDPACGELSLLSAIKSAARDLPLHLFGVDVDAEAIATSENSPLALSGGLKLFREDFLSPSGSKVASSKYWRNRIGAIDLLIANPPWSSDRIYPSNLLKSKGFSLAKGQYDSYTLFVELGLKLLRRGGTAAFILPDSFYAGEGTQLRKLIAENYTIKVLARLGEKLFPSVNRATTVLVVSNQRPSDGDQVACFRLTPEARSSVLQGKSSLDNEFLKSTHFVQQARFQKADGYAFDIDASENDEVLLGKMRSFDVRWNQDVVFGRGVEISKSGHLAECSGCGLFQGVSKKQREESKKVCKFCGKSFRFGSVLSAIQTNPTSDSTRVFVGEDVQRYRLTNGHYLTLNVPGVSYKQLSLYDPPKLLVRKTGLGINSAVDVSGSYVTQTVYVLKLKESSAESGKLWFYSAVLNSRLMLFYYLKTFGENEWKSHPYLTKQILFSLPVISAESIDGEILNEIANLSRALHREYTKRVDIELENLIFELYGVSKSERKLVRQTLAGLPDLQAFNRMKL